MEGEERYARRTIRGGSIEWHFEAEATGEGRAITGNRKVRGKVAGPRKDGDSIG